MKICNLQSLLLLLATRKKNTMNYLATILCCTNRHARQVCPNFEIISYFSYALYHKFHIHSLIWLICILGIANQLRRITLRGTGYEGVYIGISEQVPENWKLVENLVTLLRKFSITLYAKTFNRPDTRCMKIGFFRISCLTAIKSCWAFFELSGWDSRVLISSLLINRLTVEW